MRLYLIRHGRQMSRLCNVNVALDEAGRKQAALAGERLKHTGIEKIYVSDLIRARQTAEEANRFWQVPVEVRPELREISFGDLEGLSDEEIAVRFAGFLQEQKKMDRDIPHPGGECGKDVVDRALPVFQEIAESGLSQVAVVTHGGVIRCMTAHMLGMDLARWRALGSCLENCGITEFYYHEDTKKFTVERFNDYAHLEAYPSLLRSNWK